MGGPSGLVAGLVVVLVLAALGVVALVGLVLIVVGAVTSRDGHPRGVLWVGIGTLASCWAFVLATSTWVGLTNDPDTLRLDLREPITEASLDKDHDPGFPGAYSYTSDQVDLVLPDGSEFEQDVDTVTVWASGGTVTGVSAVRRLDDPAEEAEVAAEWAEDLGVDTDDLPSTGSWMRDATVDGVTSNLRLRADDGGDGARLSVSIDLDGAGGPDPAEPAPDPV